MFSFLGGFTDQWSHHYSKIFSLGGRDSPTPPTDGGAPLIALHHFSQERLCLTYIISIANSKDMSSIILKFFLRWSNYVTTYCVSHMRHKYFCVSLGTDLRDTRRYK